jgi:Holliday junction resolvase-like predicted endonuclease
VTIAKQRRLRTLAVRFLAEHPLDVGAAAGSIRFDVVAVTGSAVDVIEAAF